ncbi:MAG: hypothetical protein NVSMB39_0770 [Candidatus Saccharimonadales bacterium]
MSKRILFIFAAVILAAAGIFYRASSAHTARLQADEIVKTDTAGGDTALAIESLKNFAALHMGASATFTLQGSYDRALAQSKAAVAAPSSTNSQVYADAQRACAGKSDSITQAKCNEAYISAHLTPATPAPAPVAEPKLADYRRSVKSPLWTPDLAGALLLGAAVAALAALIFRGKPR